MDPELAKKRAPGRPMKAPKRGKRAPLSLLVRPEIKRLVDKLATANGITQSAQGEMLIEQGLAVRQVLDAMGKEMEEIERGNVEMALRRKGYTPIYTVKDGKEWKLWAEPGYPGIQTSGFEAWQPGELKAAYPDYDEDAPSEVTELPPLPPEMAGIDPDRLYLEMVKGEGLKWRVGKAGWPSSRGEGENK
jgi:hypothetical protein